ncbi:MAG: hypothetical protein Q9P01_07210 [Anaerolineae bacterium]|nr:hypothetical protein [Anaerolineae bacterium]MDQ7034614.1 hypothetical protein [Anaerolineae bacterium]
MKKRTSYQLTQLQRELHKRAVKEEDEDKRRDYWRLYFKAQHAQHEVRALVMDAEIRRLLDFALAYGQLPDHLADESEPSDNKPDSDKPPPVDDSMDEDDIPPRQKGLWE